ncbi:MAG: hypothetical protein IPK82_37315 [Polyangiaceae bacterium]|nr:hypothetical protein [Polyangiaceae bacterium]
MTHRIRVAWLCAAFTALGVSLAISACYNGDQSCSEAYNPNDFGDHCPYGPPGGPKLTGENAPKCPEIAKLDSASPECAITFTEVYARLDAADGGNCSNGGQGCHTGSIKGIASLNGEQAMLDGLAVYKGEVGRKYFDPEEPLKSWWVCNLRGDAGKLMPTGGTPKMKAADIALVEKWLACGAKLGAATKVVSGGGGDGGASGGGGSGGAD